MADQVLMPNHPMGILKMDFERILGVPFFIVVLTPSCCAKIGTRNCQDFCPHYTGQTEILVFWPTK